VNVFAHQPTLIWPRQSPIEGQPADVVKIVTDCGGWFATAPFPKLFVNEDPGAILTGTYWDFCRTWTNQTEVTAPGITSSTKTPRTDRRSIGRLVPHQRGDGTRLARHPAKRCQISHFYSAVVDIVADIWLSSVGVASGLRP
jgi:hypothetical protein